MDQDIYDTTWSLLESNPDLQEDIESILETDEEWHRWDFDDIDADSGTFGKLVDRGLIEKDGSKYTVADRTAITEAISDYQNGTKQTTAKTPPNTDDEGGVGSLLEQGGATTGTVNQYLRYVNWNVIGLIAALLSVAGMRMLTADDMFRENNIISPANDPYYYRYVQAEMLEHAEGITDIGALSAEVGEERRRPLTHIFNWLLPELLGESQTVADWTAALLPVTLAVLTGALIYMLAVKVTEDARVGILAVIFYAIAPVHLVYTSVGFLEHRAHQYFWLLVMAVSLAWFAVDLRQRLAHAPNAMCAIRGHLNDRRTWAVTGVFTLAVAVTPHLWGGSPLHFIPVAGYIALRVLMDARNDVSPLRSLAPVLIGLGAGGLIAYVPHAIWGWHSTFVVLTPLLVFGGGVAVALYAEWGMRQKISATTLLAGQGVIGVSGIIAFRMLLPKEFSAAWDRADTLFFREGAVEAGSLFTEIQRPLRQIGPSFYIGVIGIVIGLLVVRRDYRPSWLLITVFSVYYVFLAALQIRFAAQLVMFISIFGAVTTIYALSKFNLVRPVRAIKNIGAESAPSSGIISRVRSPSLPRSLFTGFIIGVVILALISGAFLSLEPILDDITHEERYDAAAEFNEHAEQIDREYPENYVLSSWGNSRMYNYFVNGEARSYGYASRNFEDFMSDSDPDAWHDEFKDRVGYVAVPPVPSPEGTVHNQLWEDIGMGESSVSHYQFLGDMNGNRMFAVVDGATINVENEDGVVGAQRQGEVIEGHSYGIEGVGNATVAYEGTYTVFTDDGPTEVSINESQVYEGDEIEISI